MHGAEREGIAAAFRLEIRVHTTPTPAFEIQVVPQESALCAIGTYQRHRQAFPASKAAMAPQKAAPRDQHDSPPHEGQRASDSSPQPSPARAAKAQGRQGTLLMTPGSAQKHSDSWNFWQQKLLSTTLANSICSTIDKYHATSKGQAIGYLSVPQQNTLTWESWHEEV